MTNGADGIPARADDAQPWPQQAEAPQIPPVTAPPQVPPIAPPQYDTTQPQYSAPQQPYGTPQPQYSAPQQPYSAPQPQYGAPQPQYGAPQPQYGAPQPQYGAAPIRPPRPVGAPGLGITALGLGIASIVLAVVYCVLFFSSMSNVFSLGNGELFHGVSTLLGISGLVVGIVAVVQRRGRRQATIGIVLSCIGIVFPLLTQVAYLLFLLVAMAPIVFS
ncbi:MAG: hypothetical protein J7484_07295 [Microbacterium sp.]|nr:hypothetical protein [Microbacterium sp.]